MSIVLSILQIIGWILLVVLLVVVAALLVVLFCPVHYLIEGEWLEEKWARFKVHWLLHLFRAKVSYGDDLIYVEIHVLWKKITFSFDLTKKEEETEAEIEEAEGIVKEAVEDEIVSENVTETADNTSDSSEKVIGTETAAELRGEVTDVSDAENVSEDSLKEKSESTESEELSNDFEKKENANDEESSTEEEILSEEQKESIVSKIKGIIERIKEIYPKIKMILTDEKNHAAVKHLKDEVIYLIKILLPKKSKIDAVFSTGSPDTTGQLFGVLACFPAMYQQDWKVLPDFEADEPYFKGTFWGRGRLSGYQLVGIVLRILFDKNCRRLYTMINKFLKCLKKDDKSQEEK